MLVELHVENFALMEDVRLNFGSGLTVFTGETGAGKSMLIDALSVLLGGRASAEFIRHGTEKARIEGIFLGLPETILQRLEEAGYPAEDGQLFLYRELNSNGRHVCRVQGRSVPLSLYRSLCQGLVDIHGQMEHQSLFQPETHLGLLDAFGGQVHLELVERVKQAARKYRTFLAKEEELSQSERERERREDLLRYQIEEITQINPLPGEEENLQNEKKRLNNAEKILTLITEVYSNLYQGLSNFRSAYDLLGRSRRAVQELARLDEQCAKFIEPLDSLYYSVEELADQVRIYRDGFEFEPGRLEQIEERLALLQRLRKYGQTIEEVLMAKEKMLEELQRISHLQEEIEKVKQEKELALQEYKALAEELSEKRRAEAERLEKGLLKELADLGLEKSRLEVRFTPVVTPSPGGAEEVEFYFSANLGEPPKPLAKVASGGEMSRVMLALKSLLSEIEDVGTFVFDEVDSGVGGWTIQRVAEKLAKIAKNKQVFCITHAPTVAAYAAEHFGIFKEVSAGRTRTLVEALTEEERIKELARMLGSGEAEIARRHAEQLWQARRQI